MSQILIIILIINIIISTTFCCSFNMTTVLYAVSWIGCCVALCGMVMAHKGHCEEMNVTGDDRANNEMSLRGLL